ALDRAPVFKFTDVKVNTYKGIVQLSGFVETEEQRQNAGEIAEQIPMVREVMNNISLKPKEEYPSAKGGASGERDSLSGTNRNLPPVNRPADRPADQNPNL